MEDKKRCCRCLIEKPLSEFWKNASMKDKHDTRCKTCEKKRIRIGNIKKKGIQMNEGRFKSIYNNLSSIQRKVFDVVPDAAYWSAGRVANELAMQGVKHDISTVTGCLNQMLAMGIVIEAQRGMFSREKVSKPAPEKTNQEPVQKEIQMVTKEKKSPVDALREVMVKMLDVIKEADAALSDIDNHLAESSRDSEKLKQLQSLLKGIG